MTRYSREVDLTVAGAPMELGVDFAYEPGEPESDAPAVAESVEVLDLYFLSPTGDEDTTFTPGQFSAVMAAAGHAIEMALLEGMHQEMEDAGYLWRGGRWVPGETLKSRLAAGRLELK
jgi:hypothetical protein